MIARLVHQDQGGHTLVELAAAVVPFALISLILFSAFGFTISFSRRGMAEAETLQQARAALALMARELRESTRMTDAVVIWSRDDGAARDGVGFLAARTEQPGRAFATDHRGMPDWQTAVYYFNDRERGELRRLTGAPGIPVVPEAWASGRLLARAVTGLHIVRHRHGITISLTLRLASGETVLETAVRPRN